MSLDHIPVFSGLDIYSKHCPQKCSISVMGDLVRCARLLLNLLLMLNLHFDNFSDSCTLEFGEFSMEILCFLYDTMPQVIPLKFISIMIAEVKTENS